MHHTADIPGTASDGSEPNIRWFFRGFLAMLPLWAGAIPFGIAYSLAAGDAGLDAWTIQLMSLTVFSAAAQVSAVALLGLGSSMTEILITAIALNLHLPLFGAAIARELPLTWSKRLGVAGLLTDATYAISVSVGKLRVPVLLGAGTSMYAGWNLGTASGLAIGRAIPDPQQLAIELVVPLTFLAVLIPMLRTRVSLLVASWSAVITLLLGNWVPLGVAILLAGATGCLLGSYLSCRRDATPVEPGGSG